MKLSKLGYIADHFWREILNHFQMVNLDEFVIMPDHIHGIIEITSECNDRISKYCTPGTNHRTTKAIDHRMVKTYKTVGTPNLGVLTDHGAITIGIIINQFKRICTITAKKQGIPFACQSRFHDRIVRTQSELNQIRKYIYENPLRGS